MNALESVTVQGPNGYRAEIEIHQDMDPVNPNEWDGPQVFNAERGSDLAKEAKSVFGCYNNLDEDAEDYDEDAGWEEALDRLKDGWLVEHEDVVYAGFEEYRHGGSAYALCARKGSFPDRRWDAIPLSGWVAWSKKDLTENFGEDEDRWIKGFKYALTDWSDFVNGNSWEYVCKIIHELPDGYSKELEEKSCWGFMGDMDGCKEEALRAAESQIRHLSGDTEFKVKAWEAYEGGEEV
jgi:hypothetical protein